MRGVVASKDLKPDDILVRVPFKAIMRLKCVPRRLPKHGRALSWLPPACLPACCLSD